MDNPETVVAFALAAIAGGARALRIESLRYLEAVRPKTNVPIVGIIKHDRDDTPVRITPTVAQAVALCDTGADIVAFDATRRPRPASVPELVAAIKARGRLSMADCSDLEDARSALAAGVDIVGTTLSGYTGGPEPTMPDFALIAAMRQLTPAVIAEGRIHTPDQAAEALRRGALCVVVGSALTRTEHATSWFRAAIEQAAAEMAAAAQPVLAIDIGGTKTLAGLVAADRVLGEIAVPTERSSGPDGWLDALAAATTSWSGRFSQVAAAVTGFVSDGIWSAMNPATLGIPDGYPLAEQLAARFGAPAFAANDAQAAAWGEYRYGAGQGEDLVFVTVSTGVGGGVVLNGRPLLGLGGHFGLMRGPSPDGQSPFEDTVSGRWIAAQAAAAGHPATAAEVFAAAPEAAWADAIVDHTARKIARLCADIQLTFDPKSIVIGGGIGLAAGFIGRLERHLAPLRPRLRPRLLPAQLGARAGLVGVADLSTTYAQPTFRGDRHAQVRA
jgi:N-acetylmannosamine-6-phosphate 2-epimerase/N-acetylmannosamine kinase